jgi:hypothetical protein
MQKTAISINLAKNRQPFCLGPLDLCNWKQLSPISQIMLNLKSNAINTFTLILFDMEHESSENVKVRVNTTLVTSNCR